ncbi:MAG: hypothetical protein COS34_08775 [Lysobacterales bacterium CG02_land_8_20_14_3_00_62_12]|nr:MAG: hypothetical protein COS34_08775 [Xanthomonadales bacterium CG02_land_8_20_14_3_00_62_12]PJA40406.1 MAG: hypothetical protein CO182_07970 [Xanthomonadales bacterium CG_4_9_14_3_um_filter_62_6]
MPTPRRSNRQPILKPQDFYLLLALAACRDQGTTYPELAALAGVSMSEVHGALKRAEVARLLFFETKRPRILVPAFKEFLFHGAKYAFPPARGSMVAGVPTAHAAAPLNAHIASSSDPAPVWPCIAGTVRGIALIPLYPSAPAAALRNPVLYESLALFDALRSGNVRERALAHQLFEDRL